MGLFFSGFLGQIWRLAPLCRRHNICSPDRQSGASHARRQAVDLALRKATVNYHYYYDFYGKSLLMEGVLRVTVPYFDTRTELGIKIDPLKELENSLVKITFFGVKR